MELSITMEILKETLTGLSIASGVFVIISKNPIISIFNLIVLYILVAFYLIYLGIIYIGISYIIIYIGAIAILFLFVIMIIDVEVVRRENNNYLPLLFFSLGGFLFIFKKFIQYTSTIKLKNYSIKLFKEEDIFNDYIYTIFNSKKNIFDLNIDNFNNLSLPFNQLNIFNKSFDSFKGILKSEENSGLRINDNNLDFFKEEDLFNYKVNMFKEKGRLFEKADSDINIDFNLTDNTENVFSSWLSNWDYIINDNNYLLINPSWDTASNRITQISAIGDILYTLYHSYIYILSIILLLGLIGAIILTGDKSQEIKIIKIKRNNVDSTSYFNEDNNYKNLNNRMNGGPLLFLAFNSWNIFYVNLTEFNINYIFNYICSIFELLLITISLIFFIFYNFILNSIEFKFIKEKIEFNKINDKMKFGKSKKRGRILPFAYVLNNDKIYNEEFINTLIYYIVLNVIIGIFLLFVNSHFSLSIKYLEKGGGFECGFTSFVQTRERFSVIFYRVSLLFLVFDLEIVLIFPYPTIYQKNQNISKNNILAFLYIIIIGFIFELKEGALNIVKKAHSS